MYDEFCCEWKNFKNTPFENLYISPNPGDAGGSIGSALLFLNDNNHKIEKKINYAYLGKKYSNDEIENILIEKNEENFLLKNYQKLNC